MPSESTTPSWVFSYIPNPLPKSSATPSTAPTPSTPSLYASTSAFFTSFHKAISTPNMDPEQQRLATIQGVKSSLEKEIAFRQKAGLSTRDLEKEQMGRIDEALKGLAGEKKSRE